jgi:NADH:ubiquinone oxidoreductase subunit F (NADH-binding)
VGGGGGAERPELERVLDVIEQGSLCAFGQLMPQPMRQLIAHFGDRIFAGPR